ncbi:MAG: glycosyltransferase [Burkholderiaceae bacterium]|nr:glycosyltransferase [Rhodoferax sp.]MCP5285819.1 glycosyltransferase [Burkholderiaceae bacterium]
MTRRNASGGRLRSTLRDLLAGVHGQRSQALAWTVAALHPRLRVVGRVRRGDVLEPLAALQATPGRWPEVDRMRARLQDMAAVLSAPTPVASTARGASAKGTPTTPAPTAPFNGRVLFALHSCGAYDPSGYASRTEALIHALMRQGVQPTLALRPGYPWDLAVHRHAPRCTVREHHGLRFECHADPEHGLGGADSAYIEAYADHLAALAQRDGVSVVHAASNYLNGAAAALAGARLGLPSVYEVRGLWHLTRAFAEPGYAQSDHFRYCEAREIAACQAVDRVLTLSPGLRDWLVARGVSPARVHVVGNAAEPPTADPQRATRAAALRARLGIPAQARVVGYLGSLVGYEGLDDLVRVHARTPVDRRPHLLLVGGGREQAALQRLARRGGAGAQVVFAGRVPPAQVGDCYAAMDVVALPRHDDTLTRLVPALKPFEVLAHRRPLCVSPSLAQALGETLPGGYRVLDLATLPSLDRLFDALPDPAAVAIPGWADRASQVLTIYRALGSTTGA